MTNQKNYSALIVVLLVSTFSGAQSAQAPHPPDTALSATGLQVTLEGNAGDRELPLGAGFIRTWQRRVGGRPGVDAAGRLRIEPLEERGLPILLHPAEWSSGLRSDG